MPLKTFENLDESRQQEILEAAYAEFTNNDFESASLSRLIKSLGLAKGSFYRYFDGKLDLYLYLYRTALATLTRESGAPFSDPSKNFFDEWSVFMDAAEAIDARNPAYLTFLESSDDDLVQSHGLPSFRNVRGRVAHTTGLLERFKDDLRDDMPMEIMAWFTVFVRDAMRGYYRAGGTREGFESLVECLRAGIGKPRAG